MIMLAVDSGFLYVIIFWGVVFFINLYLKVNMFFFFCCDLRCQQNCVPLDKVVGITSLNDGKYWEFPGINFHM